MAKKHKIENLKSVSTNTSIYTILNIFGSFGLNILYVRLLGIEIFGKMSFLLVTSALIYSLSTIGIQSALSRNFSEYLYYKNLNKTYISLIFLAAIILFLAIAPITLYISFILFELTNKELLYITILSVFSLLLLLPNSIVNAIYESHQKITSIRNINLVNLIFKFFLVLFIIVQPSDLKVALICYWVLPQFTGLLLGILYLRKDQLIISVKSNVSDEFIEVKKILKYSLNSFPLSLAEIATSNIPNYFLKINSSYSQIGVFRILTTIIKLGLMIPHLVGKILLPLLTTLHIDNKKNVINLFFTSIWKLSFSVMAIGGSLIIICSSFWIPFFGSEFALSKLEVIILGLIIYILSANFVGSLIAALNKPRIMSFSSLFSVIIATFFLFITKFESILISVLIFTLLTYLLNQIYLMNYVTIRGYLNIDWSKILVEVLVLTAIIFIFQGDQSYYIYSGIVLCGYIYLTSKIFFTNREKKFLRITRN